MPIKPLMNTLTAMLPLLAEVSEIVDKDAEGVHPPSLAPAPPLVADLHGLTLVSASSNEGSEADADQGAVGRGGAADFGEVGKGGIIKKATDRGATDSDADHRAVGDRAVGRGADRRESTDRSDVVEVQPGLWRTRRLRRPPDFLVPAAFTTVYDEVDDDLLYDDTKEDEELFELEPDMHANPKHHWDISTMMVKEALASWKGKVVKAAMEEEIRSLIANGTLELVKRPPGVKIMKKPVYGADYDETYALVSSYGPSSGSSPSSTST
ncbi:unnamed protein product [Closterium sp. NIES-64]|nr:unnamed protein product [Closterium sp. NIES-64]